MPFSGNNPIGGFKIVYEYANRLAGRGHAVNLIHPSYTYKEGLINNLKYFISYYIRKLNKSYLPRWFKLDDKVNALWIRSIDNQNIPDADVLIATAWRTVTCSQHLNKSKGTKFYFIQHYEIWNGPEIEVNATWRMPFKKIVIAKWLKNIATSMGEESYYIPNAFDFNEFGIDIEPEARDKNIVMMLFNELQFKGSQYGIEAFKTLKKEFTELKIVLFGVPPKPPTLPEWIIYYQKPDKNTLRRLYNEAAVFISPSLSEGFPLPPAEAMMCGSAVACSDIGGHREYAFDNETAAMFEPGDSNAIVGTLKKLFEDNDLRIRISRKGNNYIRTFTWERAVTNFEKVLKER